MRALAWLSLIVMTPAVAAPHASVELVPTAKASPGPVALGQVAHVHADDLDLMRQLVNLPVGRAPAPGEQAILQRASLAQWVRRHTGIAAERVAWSGAQESKVLGVLAELRGEELARVAVDAARAQFAARGRDVDVRARLVPRDLPLPAGQLRFEVRGLAQASGSQRMVAWVDVWAGGWFVRSVPVGLEMAAADVPGSEGTATADMPLTPAAERPPTDRSSREPLAVARGDWAVLQAREGAVVLESRVEVLQDGRPGQKVRVRQQGAGGSLFARVLGHGRLELAP